MTSGTPLPGPVPTDTAGTTDITGPTDTACPTDTARRTGTGPATDTTRPVVAADPSVTAVTTDGVRPAAGPATSDVAGQDPVHTAPALAVAPADGGRAAGSATATLGAGVSFTGGAPRLPLRRGTADPVKLLLHRHRELCETAVDPLEIAAGLEAHGITDKAALTRFRHRDVFALAEELYARVPHGTSAPLVAPRHAPGTQDTGAGSVRATGRGHWPVVTLLPGAVAVLTLAGVEHTHGQTRLALSLAGALALCGALSASLRSSPLRAARRIVPAAGLWVYWLLAFVLCGDGLLAALVDGGPHGPWPATLTPLAALSAAIAPAAWCAHLFSVRARRRLTDSRGLADFAAGTRPLLLAGVAGYACVLTGFSLASSYLFRDSAETAPTVALGTLLLLARLLTVHGFPDAAAAGLATAAAAEAVACASVLAGRIPGCDMLAGPIADLVRAHGAGAVPTTACAVAGLGLLVHAVVTLARASAHT